MPFPSHFRLIAFTYPKKIASLYFLILKFGRVFNSAKLITSDSESAMMIPLMLIAFVPSKMSLESKSTGSQFN